MNLSDIDSQRANCLDIVRSAAYTAGIGVVNGDRAHTDEAMRALLSALDTYEHLTTLAGPAGPGPTTPAMVVPARKAPWHA